MDSVEHVYDDGMMNKTAEPNTRASKWGLEKEKLVLNIVSELLECPVCFTIMSAPIYQVYKCYGCYFCLYLKRFTSGNATGHVAYILFMGEENEAKKFSYSLKISGDGQKLTYKGVPRSIRVCNENFLKEGMLVSSSFWEENEQECRLKLKGQISQN